MRKVVVSGAMSGSRAEDICCCSSCYKSKNNGHLALTAKTQLLPQEIYQLAVKMDLSALFTMGYAHAHVPSMAATCTELDRGPWATGGV